MAAANPQASAIGIDIDDEVLERGARLANERGLADRVKFRNQDGLQVIGNYDLLIALGITHLWSDAGRALAHFPHLLNDRGKVVWGTGVYHTQPTEAVTAIFGELPTVEDLIRTTRSAGYDILYNESATQDEWDDFESRWRRGLGESGDPELEAFASERQTEYEDVYRGILGFHYLVLSKGSI
jgi:cyclopropane fatty-acyl-phospholipid synthase-like methyltransferase